MTRTAAKMWTAVLGDDEDADSGAADDELPTDVYELQELVLLLRTKVTSLLQSARAKGSHRDHTRQASQVDKNGPAASAQRRRWRG